MVCIFCIAVFGFIASQLTASAIGAMTAQLADIADGPITTSADSDSVTKLDLNVKFKRKSVPIAVTFYKDSQRCRIQILVHDLSHKDRIALQDLVAKTINADIVERSPETTGEVPDHEHEHEHEANVDPIRDSTPPATSA